jgi:hypothetical protein
MVSGDILPSSKLGGLGLGGIKLSGSLDDGLTVLEIFVPITEKKVLNSCISLGLVIVFPLATIEVRLLDLDCWIVGFGLRTLQNNMKYKRLKGYHGRNKEKEIQRKN